MHQCKVSKDFDRASWKTLLVKPRSFVSKVNVRRTFSNQRQVREIKRIKLLMEVYNFVTFRRIGKRPNIHNLHRTFKNRILPNIKCTVRTYYSGKKLFPF